MSFDCEWYPTEIVDSEVVVVDGPPVGRVKCKTCGAVRPFPRRRNCPAKKTGPQKPSLARRAWNLSVAVAEFVADGCRTVDAAEYSRRLIICDACPSGHRRGNWCIHRRCGCFLPAKARGRAWRCPAGHWEC